MTVLKMDSLKEKVEEIEKQEIIKALEESNWVMARAAKKLGITERMIGYKIKNMSLSNVKSFMKNRTDL